MNNEIDNNLNESGPQLQMIWPQHLLKKPPIISLADGYYLRTYFPGDENEWFKLMGLAGWPGWDHAMLAPWMARVLPKCWFMLVSKADEHIIGSAMGLHEHTDLHQFGGQLGWVACNPKHSGRKLGMAVCAAVTSRLISIGYKDIHLGTEDFRLPALKTYLKLGYVPFIYSPGMSRRWENICNKLEWPIKNNDWIYVTEGS
ncbi:MAG: GNAT family N-acetyltransferase [bacterium]|nr:GNAT family N-acetyltransferase [bacterium]